MTTPTRPPASTTWQNSTIPGQYAEAEPLYQRALAIWEQQLGTDHPDTATSLNNLAALPSPGQVCGSGTALPARPGHL